MAKHFIIGLILVIIAGTLLYMATKPAQVVITTPVEEQEQPTPHLEIPQEEPTPRAPEPTVPPPAGPDITKVLPADVEFWVNTIRVPDTTEYDLYNFIPIEEGDIKTFAGSFGPYFEDPTEHLTVVLCAELYKVPSAPACQKVQTIYRDDYVSFAAGFQSDEYIGGVAAKDYITYYTIYAGDAVIAYSNRATIRTVKN